MSSLFRRESETSKILRHYQTHLGVPGEEVPVDTGELNVLKFRCSNCVRLVTLGMSGRPCRDPRALGEWAAHRSNRLDEFGPRPGGDHPLQICPEFGLYGDPQALNSGRS